MVNRWQAAICALAAGWLAFTPTLHAQDRPTMVVETAGPAPSGTFEIRERGSRSMAGRLVRGKIEGVATSWTSRGTKIAEVTYRKGARDGYFQLWYAGFGGFGTGRKMEGTLRAGRMEGVIRSWHPEGGRMSERNYQRGQLKSARFWAPNGLEESPATAREMARRMEAADQRLFADLDAIFAEALRNVRPRGG